MNGRTERAPRRVWWPAAVWTLAVVAAGPLLIERLDGAGVALHFPPLSVTASEIVFMAALAAAGSALLLRLTRRRSPPA